MGMLNKLTFVASKKPFKMNAEEYRRKKLCERIDEQIALVDSQLNGSVFTATRKRTVVDRETGERSVSDQPKRVKAWFWPTRDGKYNVAVQYGAKILELAKGKNAIEADSLVDVREVLRLVKQATGAGELDQVIASASERLKAGFAKK